MYHVAHWSAVLNHGAQLLESWIHYWYQDRPRRGGLKSCQWDDLMRAEEGRLCLQIPPACCAFATIGPTPSSAAATAARRPCSMLHPPAEAGSTCAA